MRSGRCRPRTLRSRRCIARSPPGSPVPRADLERCRSSDEVSDRCEGCVDRSFRFLGTGFLHGDIDHQRTGAAQSIAARGSFPRRNWARSHVKFFSKPGSNLMRRSVRRKTTRSRHVRSRALCVNAVNTASIPLQPRSTSIRRSGSPSRTDRGIASTSRPRWPVCAGVSALMRA